MHVKAIVLGTLGMTHPAVTISSNTFVPQEACKQFKMVSEPLCSGVRRPPPRTELKTTAQAKNAAGFFNPINFSLNSKPLTYTLFSL